MLTGMLPSTHGLRWNTEARWLDRAEFRPQQQLYSHHLARAGYRNAYVGKWHCGHQRVALDYGIEGWSLPDYGKVYMSEAYRSYAAERGLGDARAIIEHNLDHPEWEGETLALHDPSPWAFMNGSGVLLGPPEAHEEAFVAHLAVEKLRELARYEQPFSLVVSFWGPHQPYLPTEPFASMVQPSEIPPYPSFRDDYSGKPLRHFFHRDLHHGGARRWRDWGVWQEVLARCYGQVRQTDDAIGRVVSSLDDLGLSEDTLLIFCADHGDALASHGGLWDKASTMTEEVERVPLVVRWPADFEGERGVEKLVSNLDVTATMIEAAGATIPEKMHSRSLLALCRGSASSEWEDQVVAEHNGHGGELILQRMIVRGRYKYVAALQAADELYDLERDPFEMENLVDRPESASIVKDLQERLLRHLHDSNDQVASRLSYALELERAEKTVSAVR
jgi:arylsulfatase A-like enzyme